MKFNRNLSVSLQLLITATMIALLVAACGGKGGVVSALPAAVSYYVAPNGNDSNLGTISQPFLTIQKCATMAKSGEVCQIRAGTYSETAAVSGVTPTSGVVITSYPGEQVIVDGSDRITTVWTLVPGSTTIYSTSAVMSAGDTNQVFVRDPLLPDEKQMMTEAWWPNGDDLFHVNWAKAQSGTIAMGTMGAQVVADSSLPNLPTNGWAGAKIHLWSGNDPWATQTGTVTASLAPIGTGTPLTISLDGASDSPNIVPQVGGYYYLFGTLAALDAPGEWFYDKVAQVLYFRSPAGVNPNPNSLEIRVKHRQFAFDLSGRSNVTIQNIKLFASTINTDASSTHNTISGITAIYPSHYTTLGTITPPNYLWDHVDDTGIIINGSSNVLQASTISYSAGNGVALRGSNNVVQNNLIHHVDYMANLPAGISVYGPGHKVQNNTIYASGRNSIYITSLAFGVPDVQPNNADIGYNNLYNAMMLSRDGGAIYSGPGTFVTNSRIHHNYIHDTQSLYPGPADNYALPGIYLDEGTAGWRVDQNVLWNNQGRNIFLHGRTIAPVTTATAPPNNNNISNNSIFDAGAEYNIALTDIALGNCGSTQIVSNRISVPVFQGVDIFLQGTNPICTNTNNNSTALGANEMTSAVQVGCNLPGCLISGASVAASIAIQPSGLTVTAGQPATFSVTGAGSAPLSYQWKKTVSIGGVATTTNISGASGASYTTPATALTDNGAVFTVYVSNSAGSVMSNSATLTIQ
ncbi:MAG: DUF1565 domain-containing protein [Nitrosomonadales bacterium]|nr:DUF1565 domain-containing protein [Nitrosomonadales bacterium]